MIRALEALAKTEAIVRPAGSIWRWTLTEAGRSEFRKWLADYEAQPRRRAA
jgi:hypothetical protein